MDKIASFVTLNPVVKIHVRSLRELQLTSFFCTHGAYLNGIHISLALLVCTKLLSDVTKWHLRVLLHFFFFVTYPVGEGRGREMGEEEEKGEREG